MPSFGSVGTIAQTTSKIVRPDAPATVNAGDIIVLWAAGMHPTDPPTAFTWPTGFTEGVAVALKDSTGTVIGLGGWAWKRADGTEDGIELTTERNGTGGTDSHFMANSCTLVDCKTSGDPYDVAVSNAPNAVSPSDFPPITTLTADSLILTFRLLTGNTGNYGTPTDWTQVVSNQGTGGADSAHDVDYRIVSSTGTYDPTSPSASIDADTCYGTFQIAFIGDSAGTIIQGTATITSTSAISATGKRVRHVTGSISSTTTVSATGKRLRRVSASITGSTSVSAAAKLLRRASAAIASVSSVSASAKRKRTGSATIAGSSSLSASGRRLRRVSATIATTSAISAVGTVRAVVRGVASIISSSAITASAKRKRTGTAQIASQSTISASGKRKRRFSALISAISSITAREASAVDPEEVKAERLRRLNNNRWRKRAVRDIWR